MRRRPARPGGEGRLRNTRGNGARGSAAVRALVVVLALFVLLPAATAWADDPPTDTTPTTPAPDPAPPVKPKPAPKPPKPAPKPTVHTVTPSHATPSPAVTPTYQPPSRAVVHPKPARVKRHKVRHKAKKVVPKVQKTPTVTLKTVTAAKLGFAPTKATRDSTGFATLLIILSLGFAIACFGVASLPPALLPRRAVYYVLPAQASLVVLGVALFAVVALTFFWTRAH